MSQEGVILTNDDASACKRSAVAQGYWEDPFLPYFVRKFERRAPEIHRGYYARVHAVQRLTEAFLAKCGPEAQVLSLGAGFDTLYWRLKSRGIRFSNFVELDFNTVTSRKLMYIQKQKGLLSAFQSEDGEVRLSRSSLHAPDYHLAPVDMNHVSEVEQTLRECALRSDLPTVVLAECVLVYLDPAPAHQLLQHLSTQLKTAMFVNYEMVGVDDRFGEILVRNVQGRGLELAGIDACRSEDAQIQRFVGAGWAGARTWRMDVVLQRLPRADVARMERLELLDEVHVLTQLLEHYGVTVAWKDDLQIGIDELDFT